MAHFFGYVPFFFIVWSAPKSFFDSVDPNAVFLASRWHELFDLHTPDTFHPRLFGLADLIDEAVEIGSLHEDHEAWAKHLNHVRAEICDRLDRGLEKSLCEPRHFSLIQKIGQTENPGEVARLGRVLQLEGFSEQLKCSVMTELRDLDLTSVSKKKSDADEILDAFATHALRAGHSPEDFGEVATQIHLGAESVRQRILQGIPEGTHVFDCIVAVEISGEGVESAIRAVCKHTGVEVATPSFPGLPPKLPDQKLLFLRRKVTDVRAFDAVETLRRKVRECLQILALYQQSDAPVIDSRGWIIGETGANEVSGRTASLHNLHPRRAAARRADMAAAALSGRNEQSIRAALELHGVALASEDHRFRLVNLWSAMECLASIMPEEKIITRVNNLVTPILTWRKVEKIIRYLAISIHFWLQENDTLDLSKSPIRFEYNNSVPPEQLLTILAEPKDSKNLEELRKIVAGHPLLLYRLHKAWKVFHKPSKLGAELTRTGQRLAWHLWRIYRARNLLVHQGVDSPCIPQLANHLQQYFSWTLSRILHGLTFGPKGTALDSWGYWKSRSDHVLKSLDSRPEILSVGDMFPERIPAAGYPIWKK